MGILETLKNLITGGKSSGGGTSSKGGSTSRGNSSAATRANRITNYGGGGSRAYYESYGSSKARAAYRSRLEKEQRQRKKRQDAFRASDPKTSANYERKTSSESSAPTKESAFKATTQKASSAFKATPPKDPKQSIKQGRDISRAIEKGKREAFATSLQPKVEAKYDGSTKESKLRRKMGEYMYDPEVAMYETAKHPIANSLARGGVSGATFGVSELLAAKAPKNNGMDKAEDFYQKNKNKTAEMAGEIGASLASFGLTSGASKAAVTGLAPKTTARLGETATETLMRNKWVMNAARKEAMRKLGAEATEDAIARLAAERAGKIVAALGEDAAINLTTGAVSDVAHALIDSDDPVEFARNMAANMGMNTIIGGGAAVAPAVMSAAKPYADEFAEAAGRKLASEAGNVNLSGAGDEIDNTLKRLADEVEPAAEGAKDNIDETLRNLADEVEPKAKAEPETEVVPTEAEAKTENAGAGEKTTFKRGEEKTAKEEARTKRAQKNQKEATQETFDKDFAAFRKKVTENQAKASELREQIRAASTKEEKAALKEQLDALNSEIKREYNKASMRYHPDRGGSNEWMGKFNSAYDDYKKGSYQSRGFKGAESTTRPRPKTEAGGGGGSTPPPRRPAAESGEKGFRKPKGKAKKGEQRVVYKGQDVVGKRAEAPTAREKAVKAGEAVRMSVVDSHAPFEDAARTFRKSDPEKMQGMYGVIDNHRRSGGFATRSIDNRQIGYNLRKYSGTVKRIGADGKEYAIENGKSLKDIYKGMNEATEKDFDYYLLLRHAPDRAREGTPIFEGIKTTDGLDLGSDPKAWESEAKKMLEKHPEFAQKAEEVYQYLQNELQNLVDAGHVSQETASKWSHDHPFYVPTHRMGEVGSGMTASVSGSSVGAKGIKAAKGSGADIRSIRDQIEEVTRRNWEDITLNDMLTKFFGDKMPKKISGELEGGFDLALENNISVAKSLDGKKFYAIIRKGGDKYRVEIDKKYVDALKDWSKNGKFGNTAVDAANEGISKFTKVWKGLITEWSPVFMVKNPMRDIPEAFINSRQSKLFAKNMPKAFADIKNGGPYSEALRDLGISQSSFFDLDKAIREDIDAARRGPISKGAHAVLDKIEAGNQFMEMWPRLSEFMATIEKAGKTIETADRELLSKAAANAADVTVNFGRSGSIGKGLNKGFVPFFNPSVQGWSKFARNFTEQPGSKAYLSLIAKMGALGAGVTVANNYFLKDNPNYQQISARDKANNIIIPYPLTEADKTDTFIRIPQSRFASVLSLPGVNAFNKNKMGFADMITIANDQVAPVNPMESHFLAPFFATAKNKSWYGTPIVPKALEDLPKSEQTDVNTSAIGTALGKATEKLPRKMQISPKKADYIIDAETGIIGDMVLPATTPSRQGGGKGLKKVGPAVLGAATKPFTIDSTVQNDLSTRFYDTLNEANTSAKSKNGGEKEAEEYKRLNTYSTEIGKVNDAIRYLQGGSKSTKQEDIRALQKVRNSMMQSALDGKAVPSKHRTLDAVQKSVGTTYAVDNFGSSADKKAMKVYGASVYGDISDKQMQKKIDADKDFYKGVSAIGKLDDSLARAGVKSTTTLDRAVALASINANDNLFGAYGATTQSRVETANKMDRAKTYLDDGGSTKEWVKLEKNRTTVGKLKDTDADKEHNANYERLKKGEITEAEYNKKEKEIDYNANISYVGHAVSLALANSPRRGYKVYDIKDKNIQKGMNLAAMGYTPRDYRKMAKDVDADGNGYPSRKEVIDYVANSDVEDKATLFDALYYYKGSNPFGTPTDYSRAEAANVGKEKKVEWIVNDTDDFEVNPEASSSGSGYGYGRRGYRRYGRRRYGGGSGGSKNTPSGVDMSAFKAKAKAPDPKSNSDLIPLNIKTVKGAKTSKQKSMLTAAMKDIQSTQKKVAPPKAKRK